MAINKFVEDASKDPAIALGAQMTLVVDVIEFRRTVGILKVQSAKTNLHFYHSCFINRARVNRTVNIACLSKVLPSQMRQTVACAMYRRHLIKNLLGKYWNQVPSVAQSISWQFWHCWFPKVQIFGAYKYR